LRFLPACVAKTANRPDPNFSGIRLAHTPG
jgi:hypothetical protein